MLEIKNLSHSYVDGDMKRIVLENVDATFERGKFYSILGPSGSGKSTLLSLAAGLDDIQEGFVLIDGKPIQELGLVKYRRNYMAIVFQSFNLIPYLTAVENVEIAMNITNNEVPKNKREIALGFLEKLGLSNIKASKFVKQLSGGEQQRVAIARALVTGADLIFADEPTGNLDTQTEREICELFKVLAHQFNKCIIVVTHSEHVAMHSDQIYRISDGKMVSGE
ncbi:MAG TPA: ABC transporter [Firmicutes bacterium]|nr:ABC transporter [Bacillota bacterium]